MKKIMKKSVWGLFILLVGAAIFPLNQSVYAEASKPKLIYEIEKGQNYNVIDAWDNGGVLYQKQQENYSSDQEFGVIINGQKKWSIKSLTLFYIGDTKDSLYFYKLNNNNSKQLYIINKTTWKQETVNLPESVLDEGVIAPNGTIYMAGGEPEEKNFLYAFDSKGKLKWHNEFVAIGIAELLVDNSSNLYANGIEGVTVFDPSGKVKWKKSGGSVFATDPQNNMLYFQEGYPSNLYGLNANGYTKWIKKMTVDVWPAPIYDSINKNLLVADNEAGILYSYDGVTGQAKWNVKSDAPFPVGMGDYRPSATPVIETGKSGTTYYSAHRGDYAPKETYTKAISKEGKVKWTLKTNELVSIKESVNQSVYLAGKTSLTAVQSNGKKAWETSGDFSKVQFISTDSGEIYYSQGAKVYQINDKAAPVVPAAPKVNAVSDQNTAVTGTTEANATVYVKVGSKTLGSSKANGKGAFNVKIPKQKAGTKLAVTAQDAAKNTSKAAAVTVQDKTPPPAPKVNNLTSKSTHVIGTTEANATIEVKVGTKLIGSGKANSKGSFDVRIPKQKAGTKVDVFAKDADKNQSKTTKVVSK
ncbi:Ig-like domain-containing protein [Priestia megaterium]|uniref:Ig-like domain-containing protein n=1 Tax=Priestia megaterium TaxID=1404 RepID=UPI00209CF771|nr:Ig-like domain-containing protein [Priestia megaterium]MCP1450441.1 hypothetical protein [Priestia megaterium]